MTPEDVETVYEALARALDEVGPSLSEIYLAKISLALAHRLGDVAAALDIIEGCKADLPTESERSI